MAVNCGLDVNIAKRLITISSLTLYNIYISVPSLDKGLSVSWMLLAYSHHQIYPI